MKEKVKYTKDDLAVKFAGIFESQSYGVVDVPSISAFTVESDFRPECGEDGRRHYHKVDIKKTDFDDSLLVFASRKETKKSIEKVKAIRPKEINDLVTVDDFDCFDRLYELYAFNLPDNWKAIIALGWGSDEQIIGFALKDRNKAEQFEKDCNAVFKYKVAAEKHLFVNFRKEFIRLNLEVEQVRQLVLEVREGVFYKKCRNRLDKIIEEENRDPLEVRAEQRRKNWKFK